MKNENKRLKNASQLLIKKLLTKPFTPYPTRPIRMSDKTWNELKKQKLKTGKNWDKFISDILKTIK